MATAQHLLYALSDVVPSTPGFQDGSISNDASNSNPTTLPNATDFTFNKMELSLSSLSTLLLSLAVKNQDVLKLMLIGFVIETSRRFAFTLWTRVWSWITTSWYISVHFENNDDVYDWMMYWLGNQSIWQTSRNICINTAYSLRGGYDPSENFQSGDQLRYLPVYDTPNWFKYKGTWISVTRHKNNENGHHQTETLTLCLYTRKHSVLRKLLQEAKEKFESGDVINIYSTGSYNEWHRTSTRRKRPLRSVILDQEIKDGILADAVDFLSNEEWYIERGIPYRRGYLLHGVPGSGKTSLIHSIAGELGLDVYIVSLSKPGLGDSELNELLCAMPSRSILLIEDIDAAFRRATTVRKAVAGSSSDDHGSKERGKNSDNSNGVENDSPRGITLSGLLNALDGIAAAEGRLLFATTNCFTALDEALRRPGRMDLYIEFKNATQWQAKELFRSFFDPWKSTEKADELKDTNEATNFPAAARFARLVDPEFVTIEELAELSNQFGESIPADVFSIASLQGYLMLYKERPRSALKGIEKWVEDELAKKNMGEGGKREKRKKKEEGGEGKGKEEGEDETVNDEPDSEQYFDESSEAGEAASNGVSRSIRGRGPRLHIMLRGGKPRRGRRWRGRF